MLRSPLPALDDPEGERIPPDLPPIVDAHVHVFPDDLFASIRRWFDSYGWPVRYRLSAREVISFLLSRGVDHVVALCYAHRPGVARGLNRFMASLAMENPHVTALGTVFPGEEGARDILDEAFRAGLRGVKLHAHVQCVRADDPKVHQVAGICAANRLPLVFHAGREPRSPAYRCDPHELCGAPLVERLLAAHRDLLLCVPHLGMDEFNEHMRLLEKYENLRLDTTMTLAGYLPGAHPPPLHAYPPERILYGTDFPNIPYAWDRELKILAASGLTEPSLARILGENARELFMPQT
jgi:hypothetical protein